MQFNNTQFGMQTMKYKPSYRRSSYLNNDTVAEKYVYVPKDQSRIADHIKRGDVYTSCPVCGSDIICTESHTPYFKYTCSCETVLYVYKTARQLAKFIVYSFDVPEPSITIYGDII